MRIGIDGTCWANRRGYGRFTRRLITAVLELDPPHEFLFFLDSASALLFPSVDKQRRIVVPTSEIVTEAARAGGYRSPADMLRMSMAVFQESLDWMFFPSVYSYFPVLNPCRIAVTIHDTIAESLPDLVFPSIRDRWFWRMKVRLACAQSDLLFTVSELSRVSIQKEYKVPGESFRILSEAPDPAFFDPVDEHTAGKTMERFGLNEPYFLYLGGIGPHKNLKMLLDVFAQREFNACELVIVGDYQSDSFLIDRRITDTRESERVRLTGYLEDPDVVALLSKCSALILPSYYEGFGLPAIEAMAAGAPVICTRNSAIPEIAPDAALFIDPERPEELRVAMQRILNEPQLRAELSARGRRIARGLSWTNTAHSFLEALS